MYGSPELIKSIFYKLLDNKNFPLYGKEEISRNLFYVIGHNMFLMIYLKDYFQENKINDKNNKLKIKELFQESILDVSIKPDRFFINQKLNSYKNFSLNKFYQEFENSCNFFEIEEKYIFLSKKVSKDTRNMLKKEDSSKSLGFLKNLKFIFHTK